ncbi:HugZ family protein [Uliginosibacterium sediminicola]|uniref:Pyridoxamine 5'-phosphate oxidase family protein n=1 Tax=Uliginosibacterium sediminicola TaxID=2024550 RepID=A0ABU9YYG5_9RHOO
MKIHPAEVATLLHSAEHATLATQSQQLPGYPYATAVPCVTDAAHCPILFVSLLAEHTRNLLADARSSLSLVAPEHGSVQAAPRLSLIGDCRPIDAPPLLVDRYLRYQPEAAQYLALDFRFFRLQPLRLRYIGGVGRMGWLEADDWQALDTLTLEDEAQLLRALSAELPEHIRLLGIDCYGLDCSLHGQRQRHRFALPSTQLEELAQAARQLLARLSAR